MTFMPRMIRGYIQDRNEIVFITKGGKPAMLRQVAATFENAHFYTILDGFVLENTH